MSPHDFDFDRHPVTLGLAEQLATANARLPSPLLVNGTAAGADALIPLAGLLVRDCVLQPVDHEDGILVRREPEAIDRLAYLWRGMFERSLAVAGQGGRDDRGSYGIETWSALVATGVSWLATASTAVAVSAAATRNRSTRSRAHMVDLALAG